MGIEISASRWITGSKVFDRLFVIFPFWIPALFYFGYGTFPEYQGLIFLVSMLILGETHFGSTWFFFLDKENRQWILSQPFKFIVGPVLIIGALICISYFHSLSLALFISAVFSGFHVTRQSVGVLKLYGKSGSEYLKFGEYGIYLMSFWFLFIGFLRFYSPYKTAVSSEILFFISVVLFCISIWVVYFRGRKRQGFSLDTLLTLFTGMLLYSPYLFVQRPEHAVSMGVGMHFMQYIAMTSSLYGRKIKSVNSISLVSYKSAYFSIIFVYAALMIYFRNQFTNINSFEISWTYLIPISLQTVHYYVDMFIWRFSIPHIRHSVGKHLF